MQDTPLALHSMSAHIICVCALILVAVVALARSALPLPYPSYRQLDNNCSLFHHNVNILYFTHRNARAFKIIYNLEHNKVYLILVSIHTVYSLNFRLSSAE